MNNDSEVYNLLRYLAVVGNLIFVLWILYNGVNEGFQGTPLEIVSYIGLIVLLLLNSFLMCNRKKRT